MKIGDYVRTKYGIRKVIQIDNETTSKIRCYVLDKFYNECKICSSNYIYDEDIIKSSPNIIDLIEVGDYVNGYPVGKIYKSPNKDIGRVIKYADENVGGYEYDVFDLWESRIKSISIVTKEQFENMEYKYDR